MEALTLHPGMLCGSRHVSAELAQERDEVIAGGAVAGGTEITEEQILDLEREAFISLCGEEKSQARMESLLMTSKPLRN